MKRHPFRRVAILLAAVFTLLGFSVESPKTVSAFKASACYFQDNGPTSEWVVCTGTGPPWEYVQLWLYCTNAPTVAIRGDRIQDPLNGAIRVSSAVCPSGYTKHHWVYAYWYY